MSECDLDTSVPDWVIEYPATLAVFQAFGIDSSCGGKSLAYACRQQGLDAEAVLKELRGCLGAGWQNNHAGGLGQAHLRVARPTDNLDAVVKFYRDGLGFAVLDQFKGHEGFDGVMLGHQGAPYHLEFTSKKGHKVGKAPTDDNLLVFYLPDPADWKKAVDSLAEQGILPVKSFNPYWDKNGRTFADPDGYRVVLQNSKWPA
jgi:catechol 2,3-dioxygenase-like lactoylglutathione lyase family enzyme